MVKVYIAAPLFNEMEIQRNIQAADYLKRLNIDSYLPQRDGGEILKGADPVECFRKDIDAIENCDAVFAFLDGRAPDEGTVFEIGFAYALKKPIYVICNDARIFCEENKANNMLTSSCKWFKTLEDAAWYFIRSVSFFGTPSPEWLTTPEEIAAVAVCIQNRRPWHLSTLKKYKVPSSIQDQTIKQDDDKPQLSLVPQRILYEIAAVRKYGATKYPEDSWKDVEVARYLDALLRHVSAMVQKGINSRAEDSHLLHASHAACNIAFILELMEEPTYESRTNHTHTDARKGGHKK